MTLENLSLARNNLPARVAGPGSGGAGARPGTGRAGAGPIGRRDRRPRHGRGRRQRRRPRPLQGEAGEHPGRLAAGAGPGQRLRRVGRRPDARLPGSRRATQTGVGDGTTWHALDSFSKPDIPFSIVGPLLDRARAAYAFMQTDPATSISQMEGVRDESAALGLAEIARNAEGLIGLGHHKLSHFDEAVTHYTLYLGRVIPNPPIYGYFLESLRMAHDQQPPPSLRLTGTAIAGNTKPDPLGPGLARECGVGGCGLLLHVPVDRVPGGARWVGLPTKLPAFALCRSTFWR